MVFSPVSIASTIAEFEGTIYVAALKAVSQIKEVGNDPVKIDEILKNLQNKCDYDSTRIYAFTAVERVLAIEGFPAATYPLTVAIKELMDKVYYDEDFYSTVDLCVLLFCEFKKDFNEKKGYPGAVLIPYMINILNAPQGREQVRAKNFKEKIEKYFAKSGIDY